MNNSRNVSSSGKEITEDQLLRQRDENANLKRQVHDYEMSMKRYVKEILRNGINIHVYCQEDAGRQLGGFNR